MVVNLYFTAAFIFVCPVTGDVENLHLFASDLVLLLNLLFFSEIFIFFIVSCLENLSQSVVNKFSCSFLA